jgi:hypothetical protein
MAPQPKIVVPLEVNATVPLGVGGPLGDTVAVKVTDCPNIDGFILDTTFVVEAVTLLSTTCDNGELLLLV